MKDYGYSNYQLFLSGNALAFENIVKRYRNSLILFIQQYGMSYESAEDISQEVFVKLYIKKPHYTPRASFKTWLYTIAKREALNHIKKQKPYFNPDDGYAMRMDFDYLSEMIDNQEKETLYRALSQINENYRKVLYLRYFDNLSTKEIASLLKCSPKKVSDMLYNGKLRLSSLLKTEVP